MFSVESLTTFAYIGDDVGCRYAKGVHLCRHGRGNAKQVQLSVAANVAFRSRYLFYEHAVKGYLGGGGNVHIPFDDGIFYNFVVA